MRTSAPPKPKPTTTIPARKSSGEPARAPNIITGLSNKAAFEAWREVELAKKMMEFAHWPDKYALWIFPWAQFGTPLAKKKGPRKWQMDVLRHIGEQLRAGAKDLGEVIRLAVASGHGIGKSALVSMLIKWALDTSMGCRVVVTAMTEKQLLNKTWPELNKWHSMSLTSHWFKFTATALTSTKFDAKGLPMAKNWFAEAATWSPTNTEAFAGLHNEGGRILLVFDEASAIIDKVWEVAQGALTDKDTEIIWAAFGNPTRNTGGFSRCFGSDKGLWKYRRHIDSRTVEGINLVELAKVVERWGEDSDLVRVRIRGVFPRAGVLQFIPSDVVTTAMQRPEPWDWKSDAKILAVDVARHGEDSTVITKRQGRKVHKQIRWQIKNLMQNAQRIGHMIDEWHPDAVFIDATGMGWAIVDKLIELGHKNVFGIQTGESADEDSAFINLGVELWFRMREALSTGGTQLPEDPELERELTAREYWFDSKNRMALESKDDLKSRGEASPDGADSLSLTYYMPVQRQTKELKQQRGDWYAKKFARTKNPMTL